MTELFMRTIATAVAVLFLLGLPLNASSQSEHNLTSLLKPQLLIEMHELAASQGADDELESKLASALGFCDDGQKWLNRQVTVKLAPSDALHTFAIDRGEGQDFLVSIHSSNELQAYRVHRDGKVAAALALEIPTGKIILRSPSDAQADLNSEMAVWAETVKALVEWPACQGELAGAHPVTAQKKIESCTTLIHSETNTPSNVALALVNRAHAYGWADTKRELEDLEQAVRVDPKYALAWAELCEAHLWVSHETERAKQDCTTSITLAPQEPSGWTYRGDIHLNLHEYDQAIDDYNHAIDLNATWMWPWDNRGEAYMRSNRIDRGIQDFNEVIRLQPDYAMGYLDRGKAHLLKNELDAAIADFETGIKVDPKCGACLFGRGLVKRAKGNIADGDADIAKGKVVSPKVSDGFVDDGIPIP
jgi:tetratricopeptide (TPR) repeat protein